MSLSVDPVFSLLKSKFICGWRDISGERYCGKSGSHAATNPAAITTNGAGPHNTQLFILASDGTVLHCLPGYWNPTDLALEIALAEKLNAVRTDASLSTDAKNAKFSELHLAHLAAHPQAMIDRSVMQGFDKKFENKRAARSDCLIRDDSRDHRRPSRKPDEFKTTDWIMHERMAARPFLAMTAFDTQAYVDYGRPKYDKKKLDGCTHE